MTKLLHKARKCIIYFVTLTIIHLTDLINFFNLYFYQLFYKTCIHHVSFLINYYFLYLNVEKCNISEAREVMTVKHERQEK